MSKRWIGIREKIISGYLVFFILIFSFWLISYKLITPLLYDARHIHKRTNDIEVASIMKKTFLKEVIALSQYLLFGKEVYYEMFKNQDKNFNDKLKVLKGLHNNERETSEAEIIDKIKERYALFIDRILEIIQSYRKDKSLFLDMMDEKRIYYMENEIVGLIDLLIKEDAEGIEDLINDMEDYRSLTRYLSFITPLTEEIRSGYLHSNLSVRMIEADSILWNEVLMLNNFFLSKRDEFLERFYELDRLFKDELERIAFFGEIVDDYKEKLDEVSLKYNRFINELERGEMAVTGEMTDTSLREAMEAISLLNTIIREEKRGIDDKVEHVLRINTVITNMLNIFVIEWIVIFGIILAMVVYINWSIIRRITGLVEVIRRVGRGDFTVNVSDTHRDEIGELADSFNQMIIDLRVFKWEIRAMIGTFKEVSEGDLCQRVEVKGSDEIVELGMAFNRMADNLQKSIEDAEIRNEYITNLNKDLEITTVELEAKNKELQELQASLIQSEKMASIGQLAAGIAHEINNPVGFIKSNLNTLSDYVIDMKEIIGMYDRLLPILDNDDHEKLSILLKEIEEFKDRIDYSFLLDDIEKVINESLDGTERVTRIVRDMKEFSHVDEAKLKYADINKGIESTLNIIWNELKYKANVIKEYGDIPEIECFPHELNQVFMNILLNAGQAIKEKGEIRIKTYQEDEMVVVEISDTGCGMPAENINRIFEPFFTTKNVGEGTGLGLSITYGIIKKHKGRIDVKSEVGNGTTFRIILPITCEVAKV